VGEPYEKILIDLQNKPPEFLEVYAKANPLPNARAKVPVLEVKEGENSLTLTESKLVAEYLGEAFPESGLVPNNPSDRATQRLFMELCGSSSFSYYFSIIKAQKDPPNFQKSVASLVDGMIKANTFLEAKGKSGGPFLFGDQFTLAECEAAPFLQRACFILPNFTGNSNCAKVDPFQICDDHKLNRLKEWMTATLARPSVETAKVPDEEMKASVGKILQRAGLA